MKVKIMFPLVAAGFMVLAGCGNKAKKRTRNLLVNLLIWQIWIQQ